jgi:tetratricopeptide (TPR) repeat protein
LAGQFVIGLEAYQQQDWTRAQRAYSALEEYLPDNLPILYNHGLSLSQLGQFKPAIERLKYVSTVEPRNYAALINLYWAYSRDGQEKKAKKTLLEMKEAFPNDGEVNRLLAGGVGK